MLPVQRLCLISLVGLLAACGSAANERVTKSETSRRVVLTLETPSADVEDAWPYLERGSFEYSVGWNDSDSRDYPTGEFEFIGRGAANYLELGEPTDILRALVDVPAGTQSLQIQMRLRNPDGEVIWSISDQVAVSTTAPTEWYQLFDARTADPLPIYRSVELRMATPDGPNDPQVDLIEFEIGCGDYDVFKRSLDCTTSSEGLFERYSTSDASPGSETPSSQVWRASHLTGCGPCKLTVNGRNGEGASVCFADITFDVEGWGYPDRPAEQLYLPLVCDGEAQ